MSEADPNPETQEDIQFPLPPPSFTFIVLSLRAQAQIPEGGVEEIFLALT